MAVQDIIKHPLDGTPLREGVVLIDNFQSIRGGRVLDVTNWTPKYIPEGHVVLQNTTTKEVVPNPIDEDGKLVVLPEGYKYLGVVVATITKDSPLAGICVRGTLNDKAANYDMSGVYDAFKTALPLIYLTSDKA